MVMTAVVGLWCFTGPRRTTTTSTMMEHVFTSTKAPLRNIVIVYSGTDPPLYVQLDTLFAATAAVSLVDLLLHCTLFGLGSRRFTSEWLVMVNVRQTNIEREPNKFWMERIGTLVKYGQSFIILIVRSG